MSPAEYSSAADKHFIQYDTNAHIADDSSVMTDSNELWDPEKDSLKDERIGKIGFAPESLAALSENMTDDETEDDFITHEKLKAKRIEDSEDLESEARVD